MMKSRKRFFLLPCTLVLALVLWACGVDDGVIRGADSSLAPASSGSSGISTASAGSASNLPAPAAVTERWRVCEVDEKSMLAFPEKDGTAGELCSVSLSNVDETKGKLAPGATVEVVYDGIVLETWPGQIHGVKSVAVVEQGEDFLSLYRSLLDYLYDQDPGLNPEGSSETGITYGFDLTEVHNLTDGEKEALAYLFTCGHDTDWEKGEQPAGFVLGTYQELVDKGYIDGENLYWENGVLFTIADECANSGKFSFSMKKWKSGLGAIFFTECNATKGKEGWGFEPGGFAIS